MRSRIAGRARTLAAMFLRRSRDLRPDPLDVLWHYAHGWLPFSLDDANPTHWSRYTHRGLQPLDAIHIGEKQRRDVFSKRFDLRFDTAFEETIRACNDPAREGNWITEPYIQGMLKLHRMGFARSYEAWEGDKLQGGCFGVHIGSYVSIESMFHRCNNASKAAYVRSLVHLRDRGFKWMDVNFVSDHLARWGAQWVPQWRFEQMLRGMIRTPLSIADHLPAPRLPLSVRLALPAARVGRAVLRRVGLYGDSPATPSGAAQAPAAEVPANRESSPDPVPAG